jgi:hypothetical protein
VGLLCACNVRRSHVIHQITVMQNQPFSEEEKVKMVVVEDESQRAKAR